ncbi:MAG: glycoside hydrolase family 5 protein, partial [Bacteroidota bacterium]|nr:glycoside hydrolase family 5 protein [Bacteroidota bacterium]
MKHKIAIKQPLHSRGFLYVLILCGLLWSGSMKAELPTARQLAKKMTIGWNLGNMLEATWMGKNYKATTYQRTIDSVKLAGFNTVRLPVAWFFHSDTITSVIDPTWLAHVESMVDLCIKDSLYTIINIHWDQGWLENRVTVKDSAIVNTRQRAYWTQIANYFKDYDEHLIFASANEPNVSNATGMAVLLKYHQTFINAVRATGGNNSSRTLVIQGPGTDISTTNSLMSTMPKDKIANRLMVEVHYYTPPQFCILNADATWGKMFYYWGIGNHSTTDVTRNATWGEESDMDKYLGMMKTKFVDNGIPVIIGEYGAFRKTLSPPSDQALHNASIKSFYRYLVKSATSKGMITYCWDTGGIINFTSGETKDKDVLSSIMQGYNETISTGVSTIIDTKFNLYPSPFQSTFTLK